MSFTQLQDAPAQRPLIAHVIYRLAVGGMENGLVNLINRIPPTRYKHAIICLSGSTQFRNRLRATNVEIFDIGKHEGQDFLAYFRLWKLLRRLRPAIVHTRTYGTLDAQFYAALAGVRIRIQGEHGIPLNNLDGRNRKEISIRKLIDPLVTHYITVSGDLATYLAEAVGVSPSRITPIYNGVDSHRFHPRLTRTVNLFPEGFVNSDSIVIGTVGRMEPVKNQTALVRAFVKVVAPAPEMRRRLRLVLAGDGSLRSECETLLRDAGCLDLAWFPGMVENVPEILRAMDLFVNPSLGEGMSNSILEAMASGLPVIATRVGGNAEIVKDGETGVLCPADDIQALADCLLMYVQEPSKIEEHGAEGRRRIESDFSMESMVDGYLDIYQKMMTPHRRGYGNSSSQLPVIK